MVILFFPVLLDKTPGLFVYEKDTRKIRKITNTPYLIHNFFLMSDDKTIYFSDSTIYKINKELSYTESFLLKTDTTFKKTERVFGDSNTNLELVAMDAGKIAFTFKTWDTDFDGDIVKNNKYYVIENNQEPRFINLLTLFDSDIANRSHLIIITPLNRSQMLVGEGFNFQSIFKLNLENGKSEMVFHSSEEDRKKDILYHNIFCLDDHRIILYDNPWEAYYSSSKKRL